MLVPVLIAFALILLALISLRLAPASRLLGEDDLIALEFPVVIKSDDGAMVYCPTAYEVFNRFEPQDLMDSEFFGWDSLGRRFYCHADPPTLVIEETARWRDFDVYYADAYQVSSEIRNWRKSLEEKNSSTRNPQ